MSKYAHICEESKQKECSQRRKWFTIQQKLQLLGGNTTPLCIGFSEIDKYAVQIYKKHFKHKEYGDVSKIEWNNVEDFDLLCGGFPCQSFSIAGKKGAFNDTRGTLFFEIARAAQEKQPRLLLLENVKGLLSSEKGRTFGVILNTLDELGYDLQWQVLNSKNFGVPQNRERVFIIGHLRGTSRPEVFPIGEDVGVSNKPDKTEERQSQATTVRPDIGTKADGTYVADYRGDEGLRIRKEGMTPTLKKRAESRDHYNPILTFKEDCKIRRLTPTECERLQGFPNGWTEKGLTQVQFSGNISFNYRRYICEKNVELKDAVENLYQEKMGSVLCTIKGLNGEEQQINISHQKENANIVGDMQLQEISVLDITNLGNDMVTLCNPKGIYNTAEQIKKNLTQEIMVKKSILPLWKICLEESYNKERLYTILTWIKETIKNPIFTYAKTEEPITNVIIHWNWSQPNFIKEESFNLKMANIVSVSNTQRYKCLGNAITVNVIEAIMRKLIKGE